MAQGLLRMFAEKGRPTTIAELLDRLSYDELVEVDLANNRCRNIFHVEGKYFVPVTDGSFQGLYDYCLDSMVHPDDADIFAQLMDPDTLSERLAVSDTPGAIASQFRYRMLDGTWRWVEQCVVGDGRQDVPEGIILLYIFDIDNLVKRKREGRSGRYFTACGERDERTGLLHERPFLSKIAGVIKMGPSVQWCLIMVDIDRFKQFNEWYGREKGDFLLAEIGSRLNKAAEDVGGLSAYLGGDDFCLLAPFDMGKIECLFDELVDIISAHGTIEGFMPVFGISVIEGQLPAMDLLDQASIAVANAKADFRENICVFQQPMRERAEQEYRILSHFLHALDSGEVFYKLQPQCAVSTGRIVGAEALARWRKAEGVMVSPLDFVPVLERHGFITNLDRFIWEEVCIWLRSWIDSGRTPIPISVNVSQVDFYTLDIPAFFESLANEYRIPPSLLKVEITESAYVNNVVVIDEATRRLREKGFLVLMDDFGSGYSSLNTLRNLNIDVIKLDAQFLRIGKADGKKGVHILESVINMARSLNLPIVSEGVETEEQSHFLKRQGCGYVQGYKYYRPMGVEEFERLIVNERMLDLRGFLP